MSLTSLDLMGFSSVTANKLQDTYWQRVIELSDLHKNNAPLAEIDAAEQSRRLAFEAWSAFVVGSGWEKR